MYEEIYEWVDQVPLTRVRKNFGRDFSDGCMLSEVIKHFRPSMVEVHNYRESLSVQRKKENWVVLNQKVLKKLGVDIGKDEIEKLCAGADKAAEKLLTRVKSAIEKGPQPHPPKKRAVEMLPADAAAKPKGRHQQAKDAGAVGGGRQVKEKQGGAVNGGVGGPQSHTKVLSSPPPAAHVDKAANRRKTASVATPLRGEGPPPGEHGGEQSSASPHESHPKSDERRLHPRGVVGVEGGADYHQNHYDDDRDGGGGGGGRGGLGIQGGDADLRQLLLDMANYNLGQFDLHRQGEADARGRRGEERAERLREMGEGRRGEEGRDGRLPPVTEGGTRGVRAAVKGSPMKGRGVGAGRVGGVDSSPSKGKKVSPTKEISGTKSRHVNKSNNNNAKANLSPTKGRGGQHTHERDQNKVRNAAFREDDEQGQDADNGVRSRDLMRESEVAVSEVRNVFEGLEDAVKRLENAARVAEALPEIEQDGTSMLWNTPASNEILEQYPWFDPRINSL